MLNLKLVRLFLCGIILTEQKSGNHGNKSILLIYHIDQMFILKKYSKLFN